MRAYCKSVDLIAHALNEIENRIIVAQRKWALTRTVEFFLPSIAIHTLGNSNHRDVANIIAFHNLTHSAHLSRSAID